jgi:RNA polymerase sigma factor (sigma-70 family)
MDDVREPADEPADAADFSAFYRQQIRALVNFLLWTGAGAADAAELAQETMIDAHRNWLDIKCPRAWIRRVASRKFSRLKPNTNTTASIELGDNRSPLLATGQGLAEWEQRHEVLRLLAMLPLRQREVMAWTYDGYRPQEIADELNISSDAVRASLRLARRALAAQFGREGDVE